MRVFPACYFARNSSLRDTGPGRLDAWSSFACSFHEGHRQSGLFRGFAGPSERAMNAKSSTRLQPVFEAPRPTLAPRLADSGETALAASPVRWRRQKLDLERASWVLGEWAQLKRWGSQPGACLEGGGKGKCRRIWRKPCQRKFAIKGMLF
jgi:hypothetical protein